MKRIVILILFLAVITTGCSYEVTAKNSQQLQGENENWKVEYKIDFTTNYPLQEGKVYAKRMEQEKITITYKKELSDLSAVKNMEISYKDSFGSSGKRTEDFDSPPTKKQFRLGGGSATQESGDYLMPLENLHKFIMIFSGPSYEMRANAAATVTIKVDGETNRIRLLPAKEPSPFSALLEQIDNKLSKKAFLRFFSGHASDLSLQLEKFDARIITDKAISGSITVTEGDKKGQEFVPTVLLYEFTIRNEGRKEIIGSVNDLQVKIVPNENLKEISKETVGINIFDPDSDFGSGQSIGEDIFNIHEDCKYELSFDLSKETPLGTLITPSEEELKRLLDNAADASIVIIYKDEEAAHFDLNKLREKERD